MLISFSFSEDELAGLEYSRYGEVYGSDSLSDRLNRLENDFFGMAQTGDIDSRISMLSKINGNSRGSAIINPMENYYPGQKRSRIRNFWDNVSSTFSDSGSITGFTPPMSSSGYNMGYSNNMYRNSFSNFLNNPGGYCPYHNRYNNFNNRFFNRPYHNNHGFINSGLNNNRFHNFHKPHGCPLHHIHPYQNNINPMFNNYNPNNRFSRTYYQTPPNITTRSSVHIIRD